MTLIDPGDGTVPVTLQDRCPASPVEVFTAIAPIDLPLIFKKTGIFPGVMRVDNQSGTWDRVGARRTPILSDGSSVTEVLTQYDPPRSFAYELVGFSNLFGKLVAGVRGEWTMTPDGEGTLIRWTYEFKPLPGRHLVVRLCVAPLWRRYMRNSLARASAIASESRDS